MFRPFSSVSCHDVPPRAKDGQVVIEDPLQETRKIVENMLKYRNDLLLFLVFISVPPYLSRQGVDIQSIT
jgi:hypothetical protein